MPHLTLFAAGLLFLLWLIVLGSHFRALQSRTARDRLCLELIGELRRLFEILPQHRGAANALLQGDEGFRDRLHTLRDAVDEAMTRIEALAGKRPAFRHRWHRIGDSWETLRKEVEGLSAEESFQRHTALITEVVHLVADAATEARLLEREHRLCALSHLLFDGLFELMEFVGRARGIGAGVAARKRLGAAARVKLNYLHDNLVTLIDATAAGFESLPSLRADLGRHHGLVREGMEAARSFAGLTRDELLQAEAITIDPDRYFKSGTGAIQANLRLFDTLLPLVTTENEAQHRSERRRLLAMIAATATTLATIVLTELFWS